MELFPPIRFHWIIIAGGTVEIINILILPCETIHFCDLKHHFKTTQTIHIPIKSIIYIISHYVY